jgi:hypothetical protein
MKNSPDKKRSPSPTDNDPCLRCGHWIRLGPEATKSENPRWCGECNFDLTEFARLREQDEILGVEPRTKYRPIRTRPHR